jgi:hypothetical protein
MDSIQYAGVSARRFFILLLGGLLAGLGGIYAFNSTMNPYLEFRSDLRLRGIEVFNPRGRDLKRTLLERYDEPPQALVLGNSRAMNMPPALIEQETGLLAFNAAVNGSSVHDYLAFTRYFYDQVSDDLRLVVANVDTFMFYHDPDEELTQYFWIPYIPELGLDQEEAWRERIRHSMSLSTTKDSGTLLYNTLTNRAVEHDYAADGLHWPSYDRDLDTLHMIRIKRTTASYVAQYSVEDPWQQNDMFEDWLAMMAERDVCVILFMAPIHPTLIEELEATTNYSRDLESLRGLFDSLQAEYPFEYYDFSRVEDFGGDAHWFIDPSHTMKPNADRMLTQMLQNSECANDL